MMAVDLHRAGELFLCPHDQNDVGLGHDFSSGTRFNDDNKQKTLWDFNTSSDHNSELASSSTTDQTEADCIAELTQEMTRYMIRDDERQGFPTISHEKMKERWDYGGWQPNTTQGWSPFGSSYESTEGSCSQEPTPPATPEIEKQHIWDTNNNMEKKININDEAGYSKYFALESLPTKPTSAPKVLEDPRTADFCSNQAPTTLDKIRAIQFYRPKQELLPRQRSIANRVNNQQLDQPNNEQYHLQYVKTEKPRPQSWTNWSNQQQAGSGMRAVFLGGSGPKSGSSCGTGVFLPRVIGDTSLPRKKKGCSSVLIPAKVMQALQVHFDRMGNLPRQSIANIPVQRGTQDTYKAGRDGVCSQKMHRSRVVPAMNQNDISLPQDWTY